LNQFRLNLNSKKLFAASRLLEEPKQLAQNFFFAAQLSQAKYLPDTM